MARTLTPQEFAARVEKWAAAGFHFAQVQALRAGIEEDRREGVARAPRKSGALARTIRVTNPSASRAAKTGVIRVALTAGSKGKKSPVAYARVLNEGNVWVGAGTVPRSTRHVIRPKDADRLSFLDDGRRFVGLEVNHPGSRWPALHYLGINEPRLAQRIDHGLQTAGDRELG